MNGEGETKIPEFEELRLIITLVDNASAGIKAMRVELRAVEADATRFRQKMQELTRDHRDFSTNLNQVNAQTALLAAAAGYAGAKIGELKDKMQDEIQQIGLFARQMQQHKNAATLLGLSFGQLRSYIEQGEKYGLDEATTKQIVAQALALKERVRTQSGIDQFRAELMAKYKLDPQELGAYIARLKQATTVSEILKVVQETGLIAEQNELRRTQGDKTTAAELRRQWIVDQGLPETSILLKELNEATGEYLNRQQTILEAMDRWNENVSKITENLASIKDTFAMVMFREEGTFYKGLVLGFELTRVIANNLESWLGHLKKIPKAFLDFFRNLKDIGGPASIPEGLYKPKKQSFQSEQLEELADEIKKANELLRPTGPRIVPAAFTTGGGLTGGGATGSVPGAGGGTGALGRQAALPPPGGGGPLGGGPRGGGPPTAPPTAPAPYTPSPPTPPPPVGGQGQPGSPSGPAIPRPPGGGSGGGPGGGPAPVFGGPSGPFGIAGGVQGLPGGPSGPSIPRTPGGAPSGPGTPGTPSAAPPAMPAMPAPAVPAAPGAPFGAYGPFGIAGGVPGAAGGPSGPAAPRVAAQGGAQGQAAFLAQHRAKILAELNGDPEKMERFLGIIQAEAGAGGPQQQAAMVQTTIDRWAARGQTVDQGIRSSYYGNNPRYRTPSQALRQRMPGYLQGAAAGEALFPGATGNASDEPRNPVLSRHRTRGEVAGEIEREGFIYESVRSDIEFRRQVEAARRGAVPQPPTATAPTGAPIDTSRLREGARVEQLQSKVAATRRQPIDPQLRAALDYAAEKNGLRVRVTSGGQPLIGTSRDRTGSRRHDLGRAADFDLIDEKGIKLERDDPRRLQFIEDAAAAGAGGAGFGYMSDPYKLHMGLTGKEGIVGRGLGAYAGSKAEREAIERGIAASKTFDRAKLQGRETERVTVNDEDRQQAYNRLLGRPKEKEFEEGGFTPIPKRGGYTPVDRSFLDKMAGQKIAPVKAEGEGKITISKTEPADVGGTPKGLFKKDTVQTQETMPADAKRGPEVEVTSGGRSEGEESMEVD